MDKATKLVNRIKEEGIEPTPGWVFSGMRLIPWAVFVFSIIFGALAFSIILFAIQQTDFSLARHIGHAKIEMVLALLPIIWLILVFVFLGFSVIGIKSSGKGYKLKLGRVVNLSVIMSVVLGTLVFIIGGANKLENAFGTNLPGYNSINERKIKMWNKPEEGYLAGEIVFSAGDDLRIRSFDDQEWKIKYNESFIAPILRLEAGEKVKVVGAMETPSTFIAEEIRPWGGRRRGIKNKME